MAVEYIDSPTGVIGLGEGVGLETITPQRRRRVRRGDRGIFPVTPTGAESYEDPSFAPQRGFQQAYSAVPNVFERYAGLPGGARAGPIPGSGFEDVIFRPLPTDDVVEDDNDLDEELRRQTLDISLGPSELGLDPNAANYDPVAAGQHIAREVTAGANFFDSLSLLTGGQQTNIGNLATVTAATGNALNQTIAQLERALADKKAGKFVLFSQKYLESELANAKDARNKFEPVQAQIGGRGAAPEGNILGLGTAAATAARLPGNLSLTQEQVSFGNQTPTSSKAGEITNIRGELERSIGINRGTAAPAGPIGGGFAPSGFDFGVPSPFDASPNELPTAPSAGPFSGQDVFGEAQFAPDAPTGSGFSGQSDFGDAQFAPETISLGLSDAEAAAVVGGAPAFRKDGGQISFMGMKK